MGVAAYEGRKRYLANPEHKAREKVWVHEGFIRNYKRYRNQPLKFADTSKLPRCQYCNCKFATVASLKDHQYFGCPGEPAKPLVLVQKQRLTNTIDQEKNEVSL